MEGDAKVELAAAGVVAVAAGLLATVAYLGKRIAGEAAEVERALQGIRERTEVLYELPKLNFALDGIAQRVKEEREAR